MEDILCSCFHSLILFNSLSVFARVKIDFYNTTVKLEHLPKDKCHGSAIKIHIKQLVLFFSKYKIVVLFLASLLIIFVL